MKIALVTKSASTHSGSRAPLELAIHLQKLCAVTVFAQNGHDQKNLQLIFYKNSFDLYHSLKSGSFDVISFHSTLIPLIVAKLAGIPIVRTYYGTQFDAYLERFLPDQNINLLGKFINSAANVLLWLNQKIMLALSDRIIAISQAAQKELQKLYGQNSPVIYLGSNLKPTTTHYQLPITNYPLTILSVSRFTLYKGFHKLIEVVKNVRTKTGLNIKLIIAGSLGKAKYLKYLQSNLGEDDQIIISPTDKVLSKLYNQCDIYATCDRFLFFGLPILEAAQFAKPAIALNNQAATELIIHRKTGYVAKDQDEFGKFLAVLAKNRKKRLQMGKSAKNFAQTNFDFSKNSQLYFNFFKEVIRKSQGKKGKFPKKILAVFLGAAVAFVILEITSRLIITKYQPQTVPLFFQPSENAILELKPEIERTFNSKKAAEFATVVKTNSQGLRADRNFQIPKPDNTFRILMLGDSFTFGYGVEANQAFPKILEKSLGEDQKHLNFEAINAGLASGFTWDEAYIYLKNKGVALEPDLVILNVFLGNDIIDFEGHIWENIDRLGLPQKVKSQKTYVTEGGLRTRPTLSFKNPKVFLTGIFNKFICDPLALCRLVRPFIERNITTPPYFDFLAQNLDSRIENWWQTGQKILLGLSELTAQNNIPFMIVSIPVKEQVWDANKVLLGKRLNERRLPDFAKASGIKLCDLKDYLKNQAELSYFKHDSHLTVIGHQLAAEKIEQCSNKFGFLGRQEFIDYNTPNRIG